MSTCRRVGQSRASHARLPLECTWVPRVEGRHRGVVRRDADASMSPSPLRVAQVVRMTRPLQICERRARTCRVRTYLGLRLPRRCICASSAAVKTQRDGQGIRVPGKCAPGHPPRACGHRIMQRKSHPLSMCMRRLYCGCSRRHSAPLHVPYSYGLASCARVGLGGRTDGWRLSARGRTAVSSACRR